METLEIQSAHSLTMSIPGKRPEGAHSYQVNCRQFLTAYNSWQKNGAAREPALGVITVRFDRIWITAAECVQVAGAIEARRTPLALG